MDHDAKIKALHDAILNSSIELEQAFFDDWGLWYSLSLTEVALLVDEAAIHLVDASISDDYLGGTYTARIAIFTERLLVTVEADVSPETQSHKTSARSRSDLKGLAIAAEVGALGGQHGAAAWPGRVHLTLDYGDGETLVLPGGRHAKREQHAAVAASLPSLRVDLTA